MRHTYMGYLLNYPEFEGCSNGRFQKLWDSGPDGSEHLQVPCTHESARLKRELDLYVCVTTAYLVGFRCRFRIRVDIKKDKLAPPAQTELIRHNSSERTLLIMPIPKLQKLTLQSASG